MPDTIAIPQTEDELRELLTNKQNMRELLKDPDKFSNVIGQHVQMRLAKDPGILNQVTEQHEQFMINWLREHTNDDLDVVAKRLNLDNPNTLTRNRVQTRTVYNKGAVGAPHDAMFNSTADFVYNIWEESYKDDSMARNLGTLKNALSSVKPSDGGFLIPEILRAELLRIALENAIVRSRARVIPMDSLTVPFPTVDSTSNVSSVYGGVTGYWTEEGATLTASQPRFGRVELRAQKLALYTEVPNELLQDSSPSLAAFIGDIFPEAIAWFEDVAFFVGGGVGEPLGFLNAPCAVNVDRTGSSSGTVVWADIVNMYARMLPQSLSRAVWIVSPDTLPALFQMVMTGGTSPIMLGGQAGFATGSASPPMTMLGLPIIVSEKARALGTIGDVNLVDFGFYLIGDRQAMSAKQSEDFKFSSDVTAFRVTERLDGRPWLLSAITPQNGGSNTLSPFVKLTTA